LQAKHRIRAKKSPSHRPVLRITADWIPASKGVSFRALFQWRVGCPSSALQAGRVASRGSNCGNKPEKAVLGLRPACARPGADCSPAGDRAMVPVRRAGSEVPESLWARLARHRRRRSGPAVPPRIPNTQHRQPCLTAGHRVSPARPVAPPAGAWTPPGIPPWRWPRAPASRPA